MLKVFRTNVYLQAVIIAVVAALLWLPAIVHPMPSLYLPPRAATLAALALVIVEGVLLCSLLYQNKMISQNTTMPILFFLLAMSLGTRQTGMTPLLAGTLFLILCVKQLMVSGTLLSLSIDKTFGAAACLSLATILCPPMVVFLIPLIICMLNYSLYSWRDWTMLLLGLAAPYIPLELYYYLSGDIFYRNYLLLYNLTDVQCRTLHSSPADWVMSAVFLLLTIVALIATLLGNQSHGTNYTKNSSAILFFLTGSLLMAAYTPVVPLCTAAYAVPFAFCCTALFYDKKKKEWIWDIVLIALLLAAVAYNILSNSQ